jgi:cytochrome b561
MSRLSVTIVGYRRSMASKSALHVMQTSADSTAYSMAIRGAHCGVFALLAAVGALGLSSESGLHPHLQLAVDLRRLFAFLLFASVLARCLWGTKGQTQGAAALRRDFDRSTARAIYLLLYFLVDFQLLLDISTATRLHTEHCQSYLAFGVISLFLVHGISAARRCRYDNAALYGETSLSGVNETPRRASAIPAVRSVTKRE